MRQKSYFGSVKREKFEEGVLRADGCADRYSLPRKYQERSWQEDLPSRSFGSSALREERRLMGAVYRLISLGLRPSGSESLEEFVERHKDRLEVV